MLEQIIAFLLQYPVAMKAVIIMQSARLIFKPLCAAVQKYVDESEATWDNELWVKIQDNKVFKAIAFVLDYAFSIKIPKV